MEMNKRFCVWWREGIKWEEREGVRIRHRKRERERDRDKDKCRRREVKHCKLKYT